MFTVKIKNMDTKESVIIEKPTLAEVKTELYRLHTELDLGASNFNWPTIKKDGKPFGKLSYNGRVWSLTDETIELFDNSNEGN